MTMQIAIAATDGLVLASDTQHRVTEWGMVNPGAFTPDTPVHSSKISISSRHNAAIALAGWSDLDASAGDLLAKHFDTLPPLKDQEIDNVLQLWADDCYSKSRLAGAPTRGALLTLLVARPISRFPIIKVLVNYNSVLRFGKSGYMVGGHENNAAVFWPEYLGLNREPRSVEESTAIAAVTILSAGEINPHGIGGLEIWQCRDSWQEVPPEQIKALTERFDLLKRGITKAIR